MITQTTRNFRIFVSSTFTDLESERNALHEQVFPHLRTLAESRGCRFQAIDLRWGISDEASQNQQTMKICLGEIERCQQTSPRPNFIALLGDRYGYQPLPSQIPEEEFKQILRVTTVEKDVTLLKKWYFLEKNAVPSEWCLSPREQGNEYEKYENWKPIETQLHTILADAAGKLNFTTRQMLPYIASATEQEINAGVFCMKEASKQVFCCFRSIDGLPQQFKVPEFLALVDARLKQEYPDGLSRSGKEFVTQILNNGSNSSAKEFAHRIQNVLKHSPKATGGEGIMKFIQQALVDFTGKDFQNLDDIEWTIDTDAHHRQTSLKKRLMDYIPGNIAHYHARWTGSGITKNHIDKLCSDVFAYLSGIIIEETDQPHIMIVGEEKAVHIRPDEILETERLAHHKFAEEHVRFFVGRKEVLAKIANYLFNSGRRSMAIVGPGGTGKSALMARVIQQAKESHPKAEIIYRFIGITPTSSDARNLLSSLCNEISRRYGAEEGDIHTDYRDLVADFGRCMHMASADRPLFIFLDALDQLSNRQDAHSLIWLPVELPDYASVVVSTRPDDTLQALQSKEVHQVELGGLSLKDGQDLLSQWLDGIHRTLQAAQRKEVLDSFIQSEGNPLYLRLAFEECRHWSSTSSKHFKKLEPGVGCIIEKNMINRLKEDDNHGKILVSRALGYLATSRYGLAEDELLDLLSRDPQVYKWFFTNTFHFPPDLIQWAEKYCSRHPSQIFQNDRQTQDVQRTAIQWLRAIRNHPKQVDDFLTEILPEANGPRLPVILWSRLSFDLMPYMTEQLYEGNLLMIFFHHELEEVSTKVFLDKGKDQIYHAKLADYFRTKADPRANRSWSGRYSHGLSELPYHVLNSGRRYKLEFDGLLTDASYLNARTSLCDTWQLLEDYDAVKYEPGSNAEQYRRFISKHAQTLSRHEGQLTALLYHEGFEGAREQIDLAAKNRLFPDAWIRTQKQNTQPDKEAEIQARTIETVSCWEFELSSAVSLAEKAKIVFHVMHMGVIGMVDVQKACAINQVITVRGIRPLALFSSPDGRHLAVAFENGEADLLELDRNNQGLIKQRTVGSIHYQLPQFETPAMCWDDRCLIYQADNGTITSYDTSSGEQICRYTPEGTRDLMELRSIAVLDHSLIVGMSSDVDTQLLLMDKGNGRKICRMENSDITAICTWGPSRLAVAFSNLEIRVYSFIDEIRELARTTIKGLPTCITSNNDLLILATDRDTFYAWHVNENDGPLPLQSNQTHIVSRFARRMAFSEDGSLLSVSQSTASVQRITSRPTGIQYQILALFQTLQSSFAIQKNEKSTFLLEAATGNKIHLVENTSRITRFCVDGLANLLYACSDGTGFVLNCMSGARYPVNAIPSTLVAVAGDPKGGFWIADWLGNIFRVEAEGSIHLTCTLDSDNSRVQELLHAGDVLIWRGWLNDQTFTNEGRPDTLFFFKPDHTGQLRQIGRRIFRKLDGFIETIAYDYIKHSLLVILDNSASSIREIRVGSIDDFILNRESNKSIEWVRNQVKSAKFSGDSILYMLSYSGSIYCADSNDWKRKAALSPSLPFQVMSLSCTDQEDILLADSKTEIFSCRLENG